MISTQRTFEQIAILVRCLIHYDISDINAEVNLEVSVPL